MAITVELLLEHKIETTGWELENVRKQIRKLQSSLEQQATLLRLGIEDNNNFANVFYLKSGQFAEEAAELATALTKHDDLEKEMIFLKKLEDMQKFENELAAGKI